jgi:spore maturation protein CgeB
MLSSLKVLIVGDFIFSIYERAFEKAFLDVTPDVLRFSLEIPKTNNLLFNFLIYLERRYAVGIYTWRLNKKFIRTCLSFRPELIIVYRGRNVFPQTIKKIKSNLSGTRIFIYNNDDPFSIRYPRYYWMHYHKSLRYYDYIFSYREKNLEDLKKLGYENASILMSYYIKSDNFLFEKNFCKRSIDVIFIGHYEDDGRDDTLMYLINNGVGLKIFGTNWERSPFYKQLSINNEIVRLNTESYNTLLNQAKIALVFFSKLNNDEYTRRCFEIPASGAVMFSERTAVMEKLYLEDSEIVFFNNRIELLKKINYYLSNINVLQDFANKAHSKLLLSQNEVSDRVNQILNTYSSIR